MIPFPELKAFHDVVADDSDKVIFIVPNGEVYELLWVHIQVVASGGVGDRQFRLVVYDAGGNLTLQALTGEFVTAGETWEITWTPGLPLQEDETGLKIMLAPLPTPPLLPVGYAVRVLDVNAIDPNHDDMYLDALVRRYQPGA
jgi:hypothetical protein